MLRIHHSSSISDGEMSTPVCSAEDCAPCPEQYPIFIHYDDCDANSTFSRDWWFHQNDTAVHINFSNYYLLGTFFLFLSTCLLTFCCLLATVIVKTRKREVISEAVKNLRQFIKERRGELPVPDSPAVSSTPKRNTVFLSPTSVEVHAPKASVESVFTMDTRSQGEYMSNATTDDARSQLSMEVIV